MDCRLRVSHCVVPGCKSTTTKVKHHRFPKDEARSHAWKRAIQNPHLDNMDYLTINKHYSICRLHFPQDAYYQQMEKPRLKENAVPSLFLGTRFHSEQVNSQSPRIVEANGGDKSKECAEGIMEVEEHSAIESSRIVDTNAECINNILSSQPAESSTAAVLDHNAPLLVPLRLAIEHNSAIESSRTLDNVSCSQSSESSTVVVDNNAPLLLSDSSGRTANITLPYIPPQKLRLVRRVADLSPVSRILYDRQLELTKQNVSMKKRLAKLIAERKKSKGMTSYDQFIENLPPEQRHIVGLYKKESDRQGQYASGIRYTKEQKKISLHIYNTTTPSTWRELQKYIPFPSERTMQAERAAANRPETHDIQCQTDDLSQDFPYLEDVCGTDRSWS